jgi:hypothetical protein
MRSFAKWVVVVGLAALMAGPAMAQEQKQGRRGGGQGKGGGQGRGGFGGGFGGFFLLANPGVQEELKVTDDQKTKITEFTTKEREEMMARFQGGGDRPTPEQMAENNKKRDESRAKFAKETLKPDQLKRYNGIRLQQEGVLAFKEPEVQTALKLTGDQKEKLNALGEDYTKDRRELAPMGRGAGGGGGRRGPDPELAQKMAKLSKDFMAKAEKVLTDDQQKEWKELVGKPFEVRFDMGGGRRGRGQDKDK